MAPESVSFRISRNAEDLAQTVHALSQRLVKLEQRLAAIDLQLDRQSERDPRETTSLDNVERLLLDCRTLLEISDHQNAAAVGAIESEEADGQPHPVAAAA